MVAALQALGLLQRWRAPLASLCLLPWLLQGAPRTTTTSSPPAEEAVPVSEIDEALRLLKRAVAWKSWPAFENDTSLLAFAFGDQRGMPTPEGGNPARGQVVSTSPLVLVFDDFLSSKECDLLRALAGPQLAPVKTMNDSAKGLKVVMRQIEEHFLTAREEKEVPALRHILKRMHRTARVPDEYAELLQVGKYDVMGRYEEHLDSGPLQTVARPATFLAFLNDVAGGGDLLFPLDRHDCEPGWHQDRKTGEDYFGARWCCESEEWDEEGTVRVRPKRGRAVLFFNHLPDGNADPRAAHIACPVTKGEKWIAQRWFRFHPIGKVSYATGDGWDPRFDGSPPGPDWKAAAPYLRILFGDRPRVFLEEHFLTAEETQHLREVAIPRLGGTGAGAMEAWLTAEELNNDTILKDLTARAHRLARLPQSIAPVLRLKRIGVGRAESLHLDSPPAWPLWAPRPDQVQLATVMAYFCAPDQGGELAFLPTVAHGAGACSAWQDTAACCAADGLLKLRPHEGSAVLLYSYSQDGKLDNSSEHLVCPVLTGESWVAEWPFLSVPPVEHGTDAKETQRRPVVKFENLRGQPAKIFWQPPLGSTELHGDQEIFVKDLPPGPGTVTTISGFIGQVFHVREEGGDLLQRVTVGQDPRQRVRISGLRRTVEL